MRRSDQHTEQKPTLVAQTTEFAPTFKPFNVIVTEWTSLDMHHLDGPGETEFHRWDATAKFWSTNDTGPTAMAPLGVSALQKRLFPLTPSKGSSISFEIDETRENCPQVTDSIRDQIRSEILKQVPLGSGDSSGRYLASLDRITGYYKPHVQIDKTGVFQTVSIWHVSKAPDDPVDTSAREVASSGSWS